MAYITVSDVRAEGITAEAASDAVISARILECEALFEGYARTWFSSKSKTYVLNGYGVPRIVLPQPVIAVDAVRIDGVACTDYTTPNAGDTNLVRAFGWPEGFSNIEVEGDFGNVSGSGGCPDDVKGALVQWVIFALAPKSDVDGLNDRRLATATHQTVDGRSHVFPAVRAPWSGHPDVDRVIGKYRRPRAGIA